MRVSSAAPIKHGLATVNAESRASCAPVSALSPTTSTSMTSSVVPLPLPAPFPRFAMDKSSACPATTLTPVSVAWLPWQREGPRAPAEAGKGHDEGMTSAANTRHDT